MSTFHDRMKQLRAERKFSQDDLAKLLKTTRNSIANWETRTIPDPMTLSGIADFFNVSIDYLLGRTDICFLPMKVAEKKEPYGNNLRRQGLTENLSDDERELINTYRRLKKKRDKTEETATTEVDKKGAI